MHSLSDAMSRVFAEARRLCGEARVHGSVSAGEFTRLQLALDQMDRLAITNAAMQYAAERAPLEKRGRK